MNEVLKAVKLCNLVYSKNLLNYNKLGFTDIKECVNDNDYAIIASNEKDVFIVFRGSDDFDDWIDNMSFTSHYYEGYGRLHHGFAESYFGKKETTNKKLGLNKYYIPVIKKEIIKKITGLKEVILDTLKQIDHKGKRIVISGHSKGGVLAELFSYDLYNLNYFPILYTFGAPRISKSEFYRRFNETAIKYTRFVNGNDIVTRLPREYMGFKHLKVEYHFSGSNDSFLWFGDKKDHDISKYEQQVKTHFP